MSNEEEEYSDDDSRSSDNDKLVHGNYEVTSLSREATFQWDVRLDLEDPCESMLHCLIDDFTCIMSCPSVMMRLFVRDEW